MSEIKRARYYCPACERFMDRFMVKPPTKLKSYCERTGKHVVMKKQKDGDRHY